MIIPRPVESMTIVIKIKANAFFEFISITVYFPRRK
jgi:hypothetical protein